VAHWKNSEIYLVVLQPDASLLVSKRPAFSSHLIYRKSLEKFPSGLPIIRPQKRKRFGPLSCSMPVYGELKCEATKNGFSGITTRSLTYSYRSVRTDQTGACPHGPICRIIKMSVPLASTRALDARGVEVEWYRVNIPSIKRLCRPPDMDLPVIRMHPNRKVVTVR